MNQTRVLLLILIPSCILLGCETSTRSGLSPLTGLVTDDVGVPLEGAQVQVIQTNQSALSMDPGEAVTALTDEDGIYEIDSVNEEVDVRVTKAGFGEFRQRVGGRFANGKRHMNMDLAPSEGPPCARMDDDGDGAITHAEWKGPGEVFLEIDIDQDGVLSAEELAGMRSRRPMQRPERGPIDEDGDGLLSALEWRGPGALFDEIDTDGDGAVSRAEMQAAWSARHPPGGGA